VLLRDGASQESILIEPLADKPADQTIDRWLQEISAASVANPVASQEWIYLDGLLALKVDNKSPNGTASENVYVVNRLKTFALHGWPTETKPFALLFRQVLSTFRFTQ
jgi:hypothetical protein